MKPTILLAVVLFPVCLASQAQPAQEQPAASTTVTLSFPGGSLETLLHTVRGLGGGINIVASELAQDIQLPAIELRGAPVLGALQSIASIVPEPYKVRAQVNAPNEAGNPVYTVAIEVRRPVAEVVGVKVFSLATITRAAPSDAADSWRLEPKTVLSAVESGGRFRGGEPAQLSYHEESQLLFVKGTAAQIELVREILGNLERGRGRGEQPRDGKHDVNTGEAPAGGRDR